VLWPSSIWLSDDMFDEGFEIVDMCVDAVIVADIIVSIASHGLGVH